MWKRLNFCGSGSTLMKRSKAEANSEATNSIRSWMRKQKIPKVRMRKRTRKHKTSRGAGSESIKNLTASTSLVAALFAIDQMSLLVKVCKRTNQSYVFIYTVLFCVKVYDMTSFTLNLPRSNSLLLSSLPAFP